MKFTASATTIAAFSLLRLASAAFDLYSALDVTVVPDSNPEPAIDEWMVFAGEPDCDDAGNSVNWNDRDDVSVLQENIYRLHGDYRSDH
jgi:hypothetical protein